MLIRVFQEVLIKSCIKSDKAIRENFNERQDLFNHRTLMEILEAGFLKELTVDKNFRTIFLFIRDNCLTENENYHESDI
jgi:hypothetical protein